MKSNFSHLYRSSSNQSWRLVVSVLVFLVLLSPWPTGAQPPNVPASAAMGRALVADVAGHYSAPPKLLVTDKVTGAPVTGNGDLAITVGGAASALKFYVGKADFWGVLRGAIMPVGSLTLNVPALKGGSYSLNENVGPATVTGTFVKEGYGLSVTSWVATKENTAVIQLKNVGMQPLSLSSQLLDGFAGSAGNPATYGSTKNSTWLNVSPDTVYLELGNELHNVLEKAPFTGRIADVRLFNEALSGEALATPDYVDALAPEPLLIWTAINPGTATLVGDAGDVTLNKSDLHGGSAVLKGKSSAEVLVGDLPLPEKQFTISAWINLSTPGSNGCIVAAQIPYPQTYGAIFPYPYVRGLTLKLVKGALSATLNQSGRLKPDGSLFSADATNAFTATALDPLPTGQWIRVAVTYDGSVLKIFKNGTEVGATAPFPTGTNGMMGWNKMAMHVGDPNVPYRACGPQGLLIQRVLGAPTTETNQGELTFTLPAGGQATIVLAAVTDRNDPDYFSAAQKQARSATTASLAKLRKQHDQWWSDFWSKSFVQIPDQTIQDSWYASLYLLACCSTSNAPAPGLWGNFNTSTAPAWLGDYTLDYNYEATFWGALACNHPELADNYDRVLLDHIPRGLATARQYFPTNPGIYYYCHVIPMPGWSDDPGTFWGQKSLALFPAVNSAMRWKYSQDTNYAAKIYPYLKAVADFWDNYLVFKDGHYVDYHDACWENSGDDMNPVTTLAFIQLVYPSLVQMSEALNRDADHRAKWNDIIARLAPLPIVPASSIPALNALGTPYNAPGVSVIRNSTTGTAFPTPMVKGFMDHTIRMSGAGMSSAQVIFPGWNIGLESEPSLLLAASNTLWLAAQWYDYNNECNFYPGAACAGYDPNMLLSTLDTFLTHYRYNNFMIDVGGGGTEHYAIVPATLAAMFVQSYQTNLHIFPDWPKDQSAAFGQLNACGGFLVSSAITLGQPEFVRIESTAGKMLNLANPWPGEKVRCVSSRSGTADWSGAVLHYQTKAGEILTLTPPVVKPLSAPGRLRTDQLGRVVYLDWDGVPGAVAYNVKRATSRGGPYLNAATVTTGSRFTDTNAAYGTSYLYAVSALAPGQESARSTGVRVTLPPAPPVPKPTIFKQHLNLGTANEGDYVESVPQAATLTGDSGDIWGTSDSCEFAWRELAGDGSIACRVASIENGMEWAKAGVMIRETTNSVARNAALLLSPGHGATFQYRAATNGITDYHLTGDTHVPCWLKIARQGNKLSAAVSTNGVTWTAAAGSPQVIEMGSKVCIGLAVSAHDGPAATAEFDHLTVTGTQH